MEKTRKSGISYEPIAFGELPGWDQDDHLAALKAFISSCPRLLALNRSRATTKQRAKTPTELMAVCKAALALPAKIKRTEARALLETWFRPHRIVHREPEGLLTGYYEPIIEGSRQRQGRFEAPILKRPAELVTLVSETAAKRNGVGLTHGRSGASGVVPFATRAEIDAGALAGRGLELLYLESPVDVFFLQIQGSGRIQLSDGTIVRVTYDGKNGHPYTSIGQYLINTGQLAANKMSMAALGRWLKANPARARTIMNKNASYVFFRELPAGEEGPPGAIGVPLIAGRSLAIDPSIHALGSPIYVSVPTLATPGGKPHFQRLMVAHDVGGAIKGAERGDIYFGSGANAAKFAGKVRHPGNMYVFLATKLAGALEEKKTRHAGKSAR
ncbi:MAG: MltA domain-containing protein [Hyphomicrobiaceae bacterium]